MKQNMDNKKSSRWLWHSFRENVCFAVLLNGVFGHKVQKRIQNNVNGKSTSTRSIDKSILCNHEANPLSQHRSIRQHKRKEYRRNGIPGKNITFNSNVQVLCLWCVCVKSHFYGLIHFSASSHAHEVPPSYCCFYTIFLYVWFTCDAASYIPKALTRRQQQIATNNSAFFSLFFSLRSFVFVSCVVVVVAIFDVCRQNLNTYSRPKPFARYRILWRQFIRIIAVMRLCFFLC